MKVELTHIKIRDLCVGYVNQADLGVFGYNLKLRIRPSYQREYVYSDKRRNAVIESILKGYPIGIMYWVKIKEDEYELLDGQQRTISICEYVNGYNKEKEEDFNGSYSIKVGNTDLYFNNLSQDKKDHILDYEIPVFVCEGNDDEKLAWFKIINTPIKELNEQELLNAIYTGTWLEKAKEYFSKKNCLAVKISKGYIKGNELEQDYLYKVLQWIANAQGLESGGKYMAKHQNDSDANELCEYFEAVIDWAKHLFDKCDAVDSKMKKAQEWGILYNKFKNVDYDIDDLNKSVRDLLLNREIENQNGIIHYVLAGKTKKAEQYLNLRTFKDAEKRKKYSEQQGLCAICKRHFSYEEMHGDHIRAWNKGGLTCMDNLQMLCRKCNLKKSDN